MAVTYGFFNSVNGDRKYNAEQMSEYFRGIINEGVYQHLDGGLAVTAGTGLAVNVAAGRAIIQNRWIQNSAAMSLTIAAASETYARKDAVVIRLNWSSRAISIAVKTGTPAASPVAPSMTRNSTTYEMALAYVNVAANATSVTVTDKRSDSTVCGWVTVAQSTSGEVDAQLNAMKTGFDGVVYSSPAAAAQAVNLEIDRSEIKLNTLGVLVPFEAHSGDILIVRSTDGSNMTPDYLQLYDVLGNRLEQYSLSGWSTPKRTITLNISSDVAYAQIYNGTAQEIILCNNTTFSAGILFDHIENRKYIDSLHVELDTLNVFKDFNAENNDIIYMKSLSGAAMTPTAARFKYADGTYKDYSIGGWGNLRRLKAEFSAQVVSVGIVGGTAQGVGIYNLSKLQSDFAIKVNESNKEQISENTGDILGMESFSDTFIKKTVTLNNGGYSFYFPVKAGHQYGIWAEGADNGITVNSSNDGVTNVDILGTIAQDTSSALSGNITTTASHDAKMIRGTCGSSVPCTMTIVDVSEMMQIRHYITINELQKVYPYKLYQNEKIYVKSKDGNNFTADYLYVYDDDLTYINRFSLKSWNTNLRLIEARSFNAAYIMMSGGTSQELEILKVRQSKQYADTINDTMITTMPPLTAFNSADLLYHIDVSEKAATFTDLIGSNTDTESFLFFTDPHTYGKTITKKDTEYLQTLVQKYYNSTPTNFVLCGGDWLQDSDTQSEAKYKLGLIEASMEAMVSPYYPILGNHDTNYQGVDGEGNPNSGQLDNGVLTNLWFSRWGKNYYKFEGANTIFYVFDTGIDWTTAMDSYRWEQVNWFANSLLTDQHDHIAIGIHIWFESNSTTPMADEITAVINAYNGKTSVTVNGTTYDFSNVTGRIEYVMTGHTHVDMTETLTSGTPVICTLNALQGNGSFDLVFADYTARTLKTIRVGTGSNRTFAL